MAPTKEIADLQAELSKLEARLAKMEAREKKQGSTLLKAIEAIAKMNDRLDATLLRIEMVEASADAPNNAGEAKH